MWLENQIITAKMSGRYYVKLKKWYVVIEFHIGSYKISILLKYDEQ